MPVTRHLWFQRTEHQRGFIAMQKAQKNGIEVIIAGAGGAAHLPGMVASLTSLPVLAVPISTSVCGIDSLLSIVQMPQGTPVATFSIGKAGVYNAALFACKILGARYIKIQKAITEWKQQQTESVPFTPRQNSE